MISIIRTKRGTVIILSTRLNSTQYRLLLQLKNLVSFHAGQSERMSNVNGSVFKLA